MGQGGSTKDDNVNVSPSPLEAWAVLEVGARTCRAKVAASADEVVEEPVIAAWENSFEDIKYFGLAAEQAVQKSGWTVVQIVGPQSIDWLLMRRFLEYVLFKKLELEPGKFSAAFVPPRPRSGVSLAVWKRIASILLDDLGSQAIAIAERNVMPLYENGHVTGVVVDLGKYQTSVMVTYEGYALPHSRRTRSSCSGAAVSDALRANVSGLTGSPGYQDLVVDQLKAAHMQCGSMAQPGLDATTTVTSAAGLSVTQGQLRTAAEVYLDVVDMIVDSVMSTDVDIRRDVLGNVDIAGAAARMPGLVDRLCEETIDLLEKDGRIGMNKKNLTKKVRFRRCASASDVGGLGILVTLPSYLGDASFFLTADQHRAAHGGNALEKFITKHAMSLLGMFDADI